jgi:hypothetical protein
VAAVGGRFGDVALVDPDLLARILPGRAPA